MDLRTLLALFVTASFILTGGFAYAHEPEVAGAETYIEPTPIPTPTPTPTPTQILSSPTITPSPTTTPVVAPAPADRNAFLEFLMNLGDFWWLILAVLAVIIAAAYYLSRRKRAQSPGPGV